MEIFGYTIFAGWVALMAAAVYGEFKNGKPGKKFQQQPFNDNYKR